ncbi:MAG: PD40 domain-containing protein [Caldilineaceae bacterium]|nr:PD40 domain-containing protein [Caldilineaceae bacterium]
MQNNFGTFQRTIPTRFSLCGWVAPCIFLLGLWLLWPTPLAAQADAPTPLPLAPADSLVVAAGGRGATLWNTDGTVAGEATPGERLIASKRATDGAWLYVTTATGTSGWAEADTLLVFYRLTLPTEAVALTLATPTAVATAAPTTATSASTDPATPTPVAPPAATTTSNTTASNPTVATQPATGEGGEQVAYVLASTRLNIRSGPGVGYPVIGKAEPEQALTILNRTDDRAWVEVQLTDGTGWVSAQYLAFTAPLLEVAVATDLPAPPPASTTAAVTAAAAGGLQGKLVFQSSFGGPIYLYELASGALRQLTTGFDPALSPDGQQVVFTRGGGDNGIYVINVDGSNEHKIWGERELLRSPKWSPDGEWIVFVRGDEFEPCFVYADNGRCYREPLFPGGNAYANPQSKNHIEKLARVDRNGGNYRDLATLEQAMAPDWNSGGIVYQSSGGLQITSDQAEDTNRKLYFEIQRQYHQDPDWQPGGGRVVFQQRQGSHWQLFAINPDGNGLTAFTRPATALVDTMPSSVAPAWSPDGQYIVFLSNRTESNEAGAWRLWVMNADGSNQRPLPITVALDYGFATEQVVDWGP